MAPQNTSTGLGWFDLGAGVVGSVFGSRDLILFSVAGENSAVFVLTPDSMAC
jgi:hypothetical protein